VNTQPLMDKSNRSSTWYEYKILCIFKPCT